MAVERPLEAVYAPSALIGRDWRRDVLITIGEDGRISDIADRCSPAAARRSGASALRGVAAPALCAVIQDSDRRIGGRRTPPAGDPVARATFAAAVYAECAGAGFVRLADALSTTADRLEADAAAHERVAARLGVGLCIAPRFEADSERAPFMAAFGAFAAARAAPDARWALAIDDLARAEPQATLELSLAAAETRRGAPRLLLRARHSDDAAATAAHLEALRRATTIGPHWGLMGAGDPGDAGRAFNAAGGVLFGPAGPLQPKRRRGVEIHADGPTCSAALLRATFGAPNDAADGAAVWRAAARDAAAAVGRPDDGEIAIGARADLVVFDADHPALAGILGDAVIARYVACADVRALRLVIAGGRMVAAHGRHRAASDLGGAVRDALWKMEASAGGAN